MRPELLALVLTAAMQDQDAEKLHRQMDMALATAKTLQVAFDGVYEEGNKTLKLRGTVWLAPGNKFRVEATGDHQGNEIRLLTVSDGSKMHAMVNDKPVNEDAPKLIEEAFRLSLRRVGVFTGILLLLTEKAQKMEIKLDDLFEVSAFKLKTNEKVGDRDALLLEYKVTIRGGKNVPASAALWLDAKTNLPLKHVVSAESDGRMVRVTQTYSELRLDPKFDPKQFELPK